MDRNVYQKLPITPKAQLRPVTPLLPMPIAHFIWALLIPRDYRQLIILARELVHSGRCQQLGGASQFGYYYFKEYKKAGQNYANNLMEIMADKFDKQFAGWLSQQLANSQIPN